MGLASRFKKMSKGKKIALGVGAAVGATALGIGAYKLGKKMFGKKKRGRRSWIEKARQMKAKRIFHEEKRKLFKERMKIV